MPNRDVRGRAWGDDVRMMALAAGDTAKEDTVVGAPQQPTMKIPIQARREGMVDVNFVARESGKVVRLNTDMTVGMLVSSRCRPT